MQLESPKYDNEHTAECTGKTTVLCKCMVDSTWLTILDALSLILSRSGPSLISSSLKLFQVNDMQIYYTGLKGKP